MRLMTATRSLEIILILGLLLPGMRQTAQAMRCAGQLIDPGDSTQDVLARCQQPDYRQRHERMIYGIGVVGQEEDWYYNFGPQTLLQRLRFFNDRLIQIDTLGRGFTPDQPPPCTIDAFGFGVSEYELRQRCGEPVYHNSWYEWRGHGPRHIALPQSVQVQEWVYDLGPGRFARHVILVDGRLIEVRTGAKNARP